MNNQTQNLSADDFDDDQRLAVYAKTTSAPVVQTNTLSTEIVAEVKAYVRARNDVVFRMARLGSLLLQQKEALGHGAFMPWVEKESGLSANEVGRCIKVFCEFPEVLSNSSRVMNLSQRTILEVVYAPEVVKTEIKERLLKGETVTSKQVVEAKKQARAKASQSAKHQETNGSPNLGKEKGKTFPTDEELSSAAEAEFTEFEAESIPTISPLQETDDTAIGNDSSEIDALRDLIHELQSQNDALTEENEQMRVVFDDDDHIAAAIKEISRLKELTRVLTERNNGLLSEKNEAIKSVKYWKNKAEKLEKQIKEAAGE